MRPVKKDPVTGRMYQRTGADVGLEDERLGTPEQRLSSALYSGGRNVGDLTDLLSAMGTSPRPTSLAFYNMTPEESNREYHYRSPAAGRSYVSRNGMTMYQPMSETEGEYLGSGRLPTMEDARSILGNGTASNSQFRNVATMLRDPAVMQYFMDMYGKAGRSYNPNTVKLGYGGNRDTERSTGSYGVNHLWVGMDKCDRGENCP